MSRQEVLWYAGTALCGYLLGCINTAAILARAKGFDIRKKGSGNAGASNALLTMGRKAAVCSAGVDILKAFLPVFLLMHVIHGPVPHLPVLAGGMAIMGHMFPFWMQFRGGKGFASLLGLALGLDWRCFLVCIGFVGIYLLTLRYIALASMTCAVLLPVWHWITVRNLPETLMLVFVSAVILFRHRENIIGIINGTEIKFRDKGGKKHENSRRD
ncbi:MAG: glycerol-3-phosphate acyltransferase [Oscillospiraceae bacterium]|nr:glycerol-3-phosphate acyltransferase [Oscillospiraceae bacterium]